MIKIAFRTSRYAPLLKRRWQELNHAICARLSVGGQSENEAIDAINDFTRNRMLEDGFYRRILPPIRIEDDELD